MRIPRRDAFGRLRGRQMAAGAGIDRAVNAAYRHAGNVLAGAGTGIGDTGSDQALQRCGVPLVPVVLVDQFAIPFKTEGFKRGEDPAAGERGGAAGLA